MKRISLALLVGTLVGAFPMLAQEPGTSPRQEDTAAPSRTSSYDTAELKIVLEALQNVGEDKLVVFLKITNRTQKPIGLGLDPNRASFYRQYPTFVVDSAGNEYRLDEVSGLNGPKILPPGDEVTASLKFDSHDTVRRRGENFSLACDIALLELDIYDGEPQIKLDKYDNVVRHKTINVAIRNVLPSS